MEGMSSIVVERWTPLLEGPGSNPASDRLSSSVSLAVDELGNSWTDVLTTHPVFVVMM